MGCHEVKLEFFGAPVGLFFSIDKFMGKNQWCHLGMLMQNISLLAIENGLATCMQEAWAVYSETMHDFLNLPDERVFTAVWHLVMKTKLHQLINSLLKGRN